MSSESKPTTGLFKLAGYLLFILFFLWITLIIAFTINFSFPSLCRSCHVAFATHRSLLGLSANSQHHHSSVTTVPAPSPSFTHSAMAVVQHLTTYHCNMPLSVFLAVMTQGCTGIFLLPVSPHHFLSVAHTTRNRRILGRRQPGQQPLHCPSPLPMACVSNHGPKLVVQQTQGHQELLRSWHTQH